MPEELSGILQSPWLDDPRVAPTLILLLVLFVARWVSVRIIKGGTATLSESRRRWLSIVQNTSILLGALGVLYIWSPELSTFALSLTAFAVALAIATKEYLLCVVGALYRATASPFSVGDWVEVGGLRGEVVTEGILTTKLQELGKGAGANAFTGRLLTVPNSALLTNTVFNESYRKRYLHHAFTVRIEPGRDPAPIVEAVERRLGELCANPDGEVAAAWTRIRNRLQTDLPSPAPVVGLDTTEHAKIVFTCSVFCASADAARIQEDVTRLILGAAAKRAA